MTESTKTVEDYFDIDEAGNIRLSGTRVGLESVLYEHIHRGRTPQEIAQRFPSLSLEQVYAAILYYLHERERLDAYLARWLEEGEQRRESQRADPPAVVARLHEIKAGKNAA